MAEKNTKKEKTAGTKVRAGRKLFAKRANKAAKEEARTKDYAILLAPVITEKSSLAGSQSASGPGTAVVFRVDPRATKDDIRDAIERVFKVDVLKVRTSNSMGKVKRTKRAEGRRAAFKKAYITLKEGQSISVVEGL